MTALTEPPQTADIAVKPSRNRALDGLRGIAALVVLFHHQLLTSRSFDRGYLNPVPVGVNHLSWWLTYTPLHLFWDGTEAVFVFFVLSGYVLTLPVLRLRERSWWAAYYPRRILRLYLPVVGSLLFALVTVALVHRHFAAANSTWTNLHATTLHGLHQAAHDAVLLGGAGQLNSPLWSLKYEVAFSLLLPIYIFVARRITLLRVAQGVLLLAVVIIGARRASGSVTYLPMFALGVLMAFEKERLTVLARRLRGAVWWAMFVVSLLLINAYWTVLAFGVHSSTALGVADGGIAAGAVLLVFLFSDWQPARTVGESRPVQWLGKRSFSLYLTHEPLVVAVAFALGGHPNPILLLAICTPAALVLADVFFRFVEGPSHRLSQRAGRETERRLQSTVRPPSLTYASSKHRRAPGG